MAKITRSFDKTKIPHKGEEIKVSFDITHNVMIGEDFDPEMGLIELKRVITPVFGVPVDVLPLMTDKQKQEVARSCDDYVRSLGDFFNRVDVNP